MAVYTAPVADGRMTAWDRFKHDAVSAYNDMRRATLVSAGYGVNDHPVRDAINNFVNEWIMPAKHDAFSAGKEAGIKVANSVSNKLDNITLSEVVKDVRGVFDPAGSGSTGSTYSSVRPAVNSGVVAAPAVDYQYADLAKHYGMDAKAAYSEALQNTAYQRAVADLKRAGLNPVLAVNGLSPAGSYAAGNTLAGGSGSGSSGGLRSGNSGKYAFSSDQYNLIGITGQVVGAIAGMTISPKAPVLGASTGAMLGKQLAQSYAQAVSSASRR